MARMVEKEAINRIDKRLETERLQDERCDMDGREQPVDKRAATPTITTGEKQKSKVKTKSQDIRVLMERAAAQKKIRLDVAKRKRQELL